MRKGNPIPVTFAGPEDAFIRAFSKQTGLSRGEIVRRAVRFACPWVTKAEKPYGFRVTIERSRGGVTEHHVFPSKTPDIAKATQAARYKTGFLRLISREPLSQPEFLKEFAIPGAVPHRCESVSIRG